MCYFVDIFFSLLSMHKPILVTIQVRPCIMLRKSPDKAHENFHFSAFWVFNKMEILSKIIFFSFKKFERVTVVIKISENI